MSKENSSNINLWDIAIEQRKQVAESIKKGDVDLSNVPNESHLLICGSKNAGKTSLILRFLERDEPPKPTVALDFCYGKKSKQNSMTAVKDVAHIWELGGGASTSKLVDTVISPSNIRKLSVILVLDLSCPNELWETQDILLKQIKQRINQVIHESSKTDKSLEKDLKQLAMDRLGHNHMDKNMVFPLLVPLLVIGGKFDIYQELTMEQKHLISKTTRFISHMNGGMLQFFTTKAEGLSGRAKSALSHLAFNTALSKTSSLDVNKPIIAPFGHDSLEQIGAPPVSSDILMRSRGGTPADLWRDAFSSTFPHQKEEKARNNPTMDKQFMDSLVDSIRAQKDQELERYRKLTERKAREAQVNAEVGKKVKKTKTR